MRILRIALGLSIILNLFLVGALAGGAAWIRSRTPVIFAGSLRIAGDELAVPERLRFRSALQEVRRTQHQLVVDRHAALARAAAGLRGRAFDQTAMLSDLAIARIADDRMRVAIEERAVAFAATLPPADRVKIADAMARRAETEPGFLKP